MKNNFKKIYLIGNGFDLHHRLKTKYSDFKIFLTSKNPELVNMIDKMAEKAYCEYDCNDYDYENIKLWSCFEEILCWIYLGININVDDLEKIWDYVCNNFENNMEKASYYSDPQYNAEEKIKDIEELLIMSVKDYFNEWIDGIQEVIKNTSSSKSLEPYLLNDFLYLNFNYTNTLEKIYKINPENILHIHGKKGEKYILGHNSNNFDIPALDTNPDIDWPYSEAKEYINYQMLNFFHFYYKNSQKLINDNSIFFNNFKKVDEIIIMGLSFGTEDAIYFKEINEKLPNDCQITIYYLDEKNLKEMQFKSNLYFSERNKIKFIKWPKY